MRRIRSISEIGQEPLTVQELRLDNQALLELPEELRSCLNLQRLDLSQNELTGLPDWITELSQLKRIDLNLNPLAGLPESLGSLEQLERLHLDDCELSRLPGSIGDLCQLRVLRMGRNPIQALPEELGRCAKLQELSFPACKLTALPKSFSQLSQLHYIDISQNSLNQFPQLLIQLEQLFHLLVHDNPFSQDHPVADLEKKVEYLFRDRKKYKIEPVQAAAWLSMLLFDLQSLVKNPHEMVFSAFDSSFSYIREQAPEALKEIIQDPFAMDDPPKVLVFAGKPQGFKLKEWKEKLENLGFKVGGNIRRENCIVVLGEKPGSKLKEALRLERPIALPEQVRKFLARSEGQFLKGASDNEKEMVSNLKGMLASGEDENKDLAHNFMKSGGVPADLLEEMLGKWIFEEEEGKKEGLGEILRGNGQENLLVRIKNQEKFGEKQGHSRLEFLTRIAHFPGLNLSELVKMAVATKWLPSREALQVKNIDLRPVLEQHIRNQSLDLFNLKLDSFPLQVCTFPELEVLFLVGNRLESLPNEIGQLQSLKELHLNANAIKSLPSDLGDLQSLRWLNLGGNRLDSLPDTISGLQELRKLELWENPLKRLPRALAKLERLRELDLSGCQLERVPAPVWDCEALQTLNLHKCKIKRLPRRNPRIQNLRFLNLSENQLIDLPDWLGQLPLLQILILSLNPLKKLPISFSKAQFLRELWLPSSMDWEQVLPVLSEMPGLQKIVFSESRIDPTLLARLRRALPQVQIN